MPENRPEIPEPLKRQVLIEAGHRCAIPTCRHPRVEIAHIVPWSEVHEHKFENLTALCPCCHGLYDKDKKIDRKSMLIYKKNLGLINGRYSDFERRVLHYFLDNPQKNELELWGRELDVLYLVKDGLLIKKDIRLVNAINFPPSFYQLTDQGREFIRTWTTNEDLQGDG